MSLFCVMLSNSLLRELSRTVLRKPFLAMLNPLPMCRRFTESGFAHLMIRLKAGKILKGLENSYWPWQKGERSNILPSWETNCLAPKHGVLLLCISWILPDTQRLAGNLFLSQGKEQQNPVHFIPRPLWLAWATVIRFFRIQGLWCESQAN